MTKSVVRVAERVSRICTPHDDATALRLSVVAEIRRHVGFDAYAWVLTDPATEVGGAPLADVPSSWLAELPRQIRLKYTTAVNRWTRLGTPPVALLRAATGDRPESSDVWRELLSGYGVFDVASVVFRDRHGCWSFLELFRTGSQPYEEQDAALLAQIAAPVTAAIRRCQARTFDLATAPPPSGEGPVVLMLSPELQVRAQTPEAERFLRLLVPPDVDRRPIPAGAYNVAAQLLAVEAGVDAHPPSARVHLAGGVWITLRAARLSDGQSDADADIAVTIERTAPAERLDVFARAHGLSERESELLGHVAGGADTRRIAQLMFVSEHTVQDHLKSIFAKTGAPNRRALQARASGTHEATV